MLETVFTFKPSKQFALLFMTVFLICMSITLTLPVANYFKALLSIIIASYCLYIGWHTIFLRSGRSILKLERRVDGHWHVTYKYKQIKATLLPSSTVTPWVSVLRFRLEGGRMPVACVVFNDSMMRDTYRQLIVLLRSASLCGISA